MSPQVARTSPRRIQTGPAVLRPVGELSAKTRTPPGALIFPLGALPCLLFALYTDHAWEDWFITYRVAKNCATGFGLVFEHGVRLHAFTSPLNVLFPALYSWLLGGAHDEAVLWLYRVTGSLFLGGTTLLLWQIATKHLPGQFLTWLLLGWFLVDCKIVDFTINGQEAAFVVFFLTLTLYALARSNPVLLGLGWAGLMWSRPDSFIYGGAVTAGFAAPLIWNDCKTTAPFAKNMAKAAAIAALTYGPWLAWATWYYGTPIPHPIVAKGLTAHHTPGQILLDLVRFPWDMLSTKTAAQALFMPPYYAFGGWPDWMVIFGQILGWIAAMAWLLPGMPPLVRAASAGVFTGLFYLTRLVNVFQPWYFPPIILLAIITLAGVAGQCLTRLKFPVLKISLNSAAAATLLLSLALTCMAAWQFRVRQQLIEPQRRQIGLWLKEQAGGRRDTVFVECLGYIGFYSDLKMYDFPGMSSAEMIAARRQFGNNWPALVRTLQPDWLVLRPHEEYQLFRHQDDLLASYVKVAAFDCSKELKQYRFLPGRAYPEFDQYFSVFQRRPTPDSSR